MDFFATMPMSLPAIVLAAICAGTAAVNDHRTGRIPNKLTYPCLLGGIALATVSGGLIGFSLSVAGLIAGGGIFLIAFLVGSCGGGDVKLMAALGAIVGTPLAALDVALASLLVGGVLSVALMIRRTSLADVLTRIRLFALLAPAGLKNAGPALKVKERHSLRFGSAAALGLCWVTLLPLLSPLSLSL